MLVLHLTTGGRLAIWPKDVAVAEKTAWGSRIHLASNGSSFEVEPTAKQLIEMIPSLWLTSDYFALNPDLLASVREENDAVRCEIKGGGFAMTIPHMTLDQFLSSLEDARRQRKESGFE